jgi:glutamate/tyrosine decarboxylase-like PLP-dependent enzyme
VGFDLHKWGYLPFECACVLVRDPALVRATFATSANYLAPTARGVIAGGLPFAERVDAHPKLERLAPVALNVVCFRYAPGDDAVNEEILLRLQETGVAVPSGTKVAGRYAIRCAITNHRTRCEDLDALVAAVATIRESITAPTR